MTSKAFVCSPAFSVQINVSSVSSLSTRFEGSSDHVTPFVIRTHCCLLSLEEQLFSQSFAKAKPNFPNAHANISVPVSAVMASGVK
jgi:hypothetical protein